MLLVAATLGVASGQSQSIWLGEALLEPRFYGPPRPAPTDWIAPHGPVSNPLGFLLRPWAPPIEVCERALGDAVPAEEGKSEGDDDVLCFWLLTPSATSAIFFQASGSRTETSYVRFKLTGTEETFAEDAAGFSALVDDFHARWGWARPAALPDPVSVDDTSFEARGIQYHLWREDSDIPRLNLTLVFPQPDLSATALSR